MTVYSESLHAKITIWLPEISSAIRLYAIIPQIRITRIASIFVFFRLLFLLPISLLTYMTDYVFVPTIPYDHKRIYLTISSSKLIIAINIESI